MTRARDPDFFGVVESTAALLAGLQAAIALYRQFLGRDAGISSARLEETLQNAADLVRYIELDVGVIQEVVSQAQIPGDRAFRPGRRAFLTTAQFKRYEKATDGLLARLRRVLKITNRLNRSLSEKPETRTPDRELAQAESHLERVLFNRQQSIDEALRDLAAGIAGLKRAISELLPHEQDLGHR